MQSVEFKQDGLYRDFKSSQAFCGQLNEAFETLSHVKPLKCSVRYSNQSNLCLIDGFKFIVKGWYVGFSPLQFSKPHSYVFHFLSQMKTLTPDFLEFSRNVHINVNRFSAEFHCLPPLHSKLLGGGGVLSGIEHVCNKWGRWQVKYFVLGGKKEKIIRTNDGYPLNPEKHGCYFHS